MSILDKIVGRKKEEIEWNRKRVPASRLESSAYYKRECLSLKKALTRRGASGIIAEFKRRSPSKGVLNGEADLIATVSGYELAGASAISVLTDVDFFGGSNENLQKSRAAVHIPILRKDFIIDEYQVMEAKAIGADVILLIASVLSTFETEKLARFAHSLGLEVLLEIHHEQELGHVNSFVDVVGINNRNLNDFTTDVQTSFLLGAQLQASSVKISESAISRPEVILQLKEAGFSGFLIGETFMKEADPAKACQDFIKALNAL